MAREFTSLNVAGIAAYVIVVVLPAIAVALFDAMPSRILADWIVVTYSLVFLLGLVQAPVVVFMLIAKLWSGARRTYLVSVAILAGAYALTALVVAPMMSRIVD